MKRLLFLLGGLLIVSGVLYGRFGPGQTALARFDRQTTPALRLPLRAPRLVVKKAARQLQLSADGRIVRTYRIGLGLNPVDDKVKEGDRCTPEGDFFITAKNPKSQFFRSLALSYPNAEDAERGLRTGLIARRQHQQIIEAIRRKRTPPQETPLGGKILIHGGGSSRDWTWGCVALDNADMQELFEAIPVGTPVKIER